MTDTEADPATALLDATVMHVPFDGWSETAFKAAIEDTGVDPTVARGLYPRGAIDLAAAFHRKGDDLMIAAYGKEDTDTLRFREKVALMVRLRLEAVEDKEAVRRGATLFALPMHAAEGSKLIWGTADRIWTALGDTSRDINWYTKRATLSGVYASTVLYWLGDASEDMVATRAFLDRRIDDVMQIEKVKAGVRDNRVLSTLLAGPARLMEQIKAPGDHTRTGMPGRWSGPT